MSVFLIAFRNLFGERGRFIITVGGVAFSVVLIFILLGLYQGWTKQMGKFLGNLDADFWVGQKGSRDMGHTVSIIPISVQKLLEDKNYIISVTPLIGRQVGFKIDGEESHLFIFGEDKSGVIKPYQIIEGRDIADDGEIIVDTAYAIKKKLTLDDKLDINGVELEIVGISSGGNLLAYTYSLVTENDLRKILNFNQFYNYYLVNTQNGLEDEELLKNDFPDLEIIPKEKFLDNNASIVRDSFLPIIKVLVIIALAIGIAVIGLTIYTATIEKSREFGVLKAIGYGNFRLFSIALVQSVLAGLIGFGIGYILTIFIARYAESNVSGFIYDIGRTELVYIFAITIVMSTIASFIPLKRLVSIDPAEVFKV